MQGDNPPLIVATRSGTRQLNPSLSQHGPHGGDRHLQSLNNRGVVARDHARGGKKGRIERLKIRSQPSNQTTTIRCEKTLRQIQCRAADLKMEPEDLRRGVTATAQQKMAAWRVISFR